jgi:nitroimidazol reductase NimA-like FMN-containing flavoprotein (pyridoxamine 5'-phosphate oxidase superfamily)
MASWNDVSAAAPDLAAKVQARFEATGLGFLATLRADGSPRITGIETGFQRGELWLGMMPDSRKALDLQRDPRLALHAASSDKDVKDGDARLSGRAVEIIDDGEKKMFIQGHEEATGQSVPPGPFHLFRIDVTEIVLMWPEGDHLVIESWREGGAPKRVERK